MSYYFELLIIKINKYMIYKKKFLQEKKTIKKNLKKVLLFMTF